jgi:hypothetical protein
MLKFFFAMGAESLDLHTLFEAGVNAPHRANEFSMP